MKINRQIAAKIVRFDSVNSDIIGRKFTTFAHNIVGLLSFKPLKAPSRMVNASSNAIAMNKGRSWRRLRTSAKFNWLP